MIESINICNYMRQKDTDQENPSSSEEKPKSMAQIRSELISDIMNRIEDNGCETEEEKQREMSKIRAKLEGGKKLSSKEMSFLKRSDPALYQQALRVQNMREQLKNRLRQCKSKEEAHNAISMAFEGIADHSCRADHYPFTGLRDVE